MTTDSIISKVWSFCHTLRDDGVGYGDYLEQLTYLIFLKMADEYLKPPHNRKVGVPARYARPVMRPLKGAELEVHYVEALRELGTQKGMLGQIFTKAQNKIQDPAKLARLKTSLDLFWPKDDSLADLDNLPEPAELAEEIIENIETGPANFRAVAAALGK